MNNGCEALLITGLYGSGKSSLVEELAERLEAVDAAYGAIDVDWLYWYQPPKDLSDEKQLGAQNLADVARRYRNAGIRYLLLAAAARDDAEVETMRNAVGCPLRVLLLDTPLAVIDQRLSQSPTSGRARDRAAAHAWVDRGWGRITCDLTLPGDGALPELTSTTLAWLGWPGAA